MKIVITVEGGMLQGITCNDQELEVCVLDFDTDAQFASKIKTYPDNESQECNIYKEIIRQDKNFVDHYFKELEKVEK